MSESSTSQQIPATAAEPLSPQVHQSIAEAVDRQLPRTIQTLTDLVSIPGIAWDSFDREPLERSAQAVAELLRGLGLQDVQILTEDKPADATGEVRPGGPLSLIHI